jgi:hypothetical protein
MPNSQDPGTRDRDVSSFLTIENNAEESVLRDAPNVDFYPKSGKFKDVSRPITELPQQTTCVSFWESSRDTEPLSTLDLKIFTHVLSKLENVVLSGVSTPCSGFPSHVLWSCTPGFGNFELPYRLRSTRSDDGRNSRTRSSELQFLPQLPDHDSIALEHVKWDSTEPTNHPARSSPDRPSL